MSTVSVIVRIQLSAESAPAYAEAAKAVVAATREESGCQWYGIAVDVADPCVVWVSEQWASQADLCTPQDASCGDLFGGLCRT